MDQAGRVQLKNDVRLVISMIDALNRQVDSGNLKLEDAQELVKQEILGAKPANGYRPINTRFDLGANGFFFVLDKQGMSLASPTSEGKNLWSSQAKDGTFFIQDVIKAGSNGGGYTTYEWPLASNPNKTDIKITYSEMDPHWGWIVCAGSYLTDYNGAANQILYFLLIVLGVSLIVGAVITWVFAKRITTPILQIAKQVEQVSNGDLTIEPVEVKNRDEIGSLARDFNVMLTSLKKIIRQVATSAEQVAASSEELTAGSEQTTRATEHAATTIQQMAVGSEQITRSIEDTDQTVAQMASVVKKISVNANHVATSAIQASDMAQEGHIAINSAVEQMNSISNTVRGLSDVVKGLGERSDQIGDIIGAITGIAEQTNLLALNAAIEAARAGEHGRGFAVVADEVRKLAEQSAQSAHQIEDLIGTIQNEIKSAVRGMEIGSQEVAKGIEVVQVAGDSFDKIEDSVNQVTTQIQEVSAAVQEMSAGAEELVKTIHRITTVMEESASGIQNISATSQEQLASMEEIASSASTLSKMAEELQKVVQKFKL
ncbi:methyl-accepting chemotaxis protein [Effusibacillus dendaii]|uniref:Chemotaxis protein n=1 Tax=Effusibacillus dendaii TaxID=2743772 RepID=A0A7I8DCX6_9BACL|nr:methyl-accepting chemotaxis protein [Effusibacillus dendaii]BCJ87955.1 chemotaxis protein [Effusibacillus dendaii]